MRKLGADEAALWAKVTATIRPLSRDRHDPDRIVPTMPPPPALPREKAVVAERPAAIRPKPAPIQQATLDGSWDRKVRTGRIDPDRTLDLHGHSLDSAWQSIDRALERAVESGDRVLLLITGHERRGEPPLERGRIRAAVNDWLAHSRHAGSIAAVRNAHRRHGGGGSLYIIFRRR